jgi:hypothetical protein
MFFINLEKSSNRSYSGQFGCRFAFKLRIDRTECRGARAEPKTRGTAVLIGCRGY